MTDFRTLNLSSIHHTFFDKKARQGAVFLEGLRHSRKRFEETTTAIQWPDFEFETATSVAHLLNYHSLLEMALQCGAIHPTFRDPMFANVETNLSFKPFQIPFQKLNSMNLIARLQRRISGEIRATGPYSLEGCQLFFEFLTMTASLKFDGDIQLFLVILDGGEAVGRNYTHLLDILKTPEALAIALSELDSADGGAQIVRGLVRLLELCVVLVQLINMTEIDRVLRAEMGLYHSDLFQVNGRLEKLKAIALIFEAFGGNAREVESSLDILKMYDQRLSVEEMVLIQERTIPSKEFSSLLAEAGISRTEARTVCSACGVVDATVPFKPTQGRPVLCRECFRLKRHPGMNFETPEIPSPEVNLGTSEISRSDVSSDPPPERRNRFSTN